MFYVLIIIANNNNTFIKHTTHKIKCLKYIGPNYNVPPHINRK